MYYFNVWVLRKYVRTGEIIAIISRNSLHASHWYSPMSSRIVLKSSNMTWSHQSSDKRMNIKDYSRRATTYRLYLRHRKESNRKGKDRNRRLAFDAEIAGKNSITETRKNSKNKKKKLFSVSISNKISTYVRNDFFIVTLIDCLMNQNWCWFTLKRIIFNLYHRHLVQCSTSRDVELPA